MTPSTTEKQRLAEACKEHLKSGGDAITEAAFASGWQARKDWEQSRKPVEGDVQETARRVLADVERAEFIDPEDALALAEAVPSIHPEQGQQPEVSELLRDMRCQVQYSHVATMPIPLYERMKAVIQQQSVVKELP